MKTVKATFEGYNVGAEKYAERYHINLLEEEVDEYKVLLMTAGWEPDPRGIKFKCPKTGTILDYEETVTLKFDKHYKTLIESWLDIEIVLV
jgi:hypothetical protein